MSAVEFVPVSDASAPAWAKEPPATGLSLLFDELVRLGDPVALDVVNDTARWLGIAIAGLINALNPAAIVLGGPTAEWGEVLIEAVRRAVEARTLPLSRAAVQVVSVPPAQNGRSLARMP